MQIARRNEMAVLDIFRGGQASSCLRPGDAPPGMGPFVSPKLRRGGRASESGSSKASMTNQRRSLQNNLGTRFVVKTSNKIYL